MTAAAALLTSADAAAEFSAEAAQRAVELEARVKRDAVVDTRAFTAVVSRPVVENDSKPATIDNIVLDAASQHMRVAITDLAHDQIAQRTDIPKDYYRRMLATQPELLAENINTWFSREPEKRLFRMLTPTNDIEQARHTRLGTAMTLRGVLGATYRMIDDAEVVATLLPVARDHGALLKSFSLDDRRLHAQFVTREQSVQDIRARVAEQYGVDVANVARHHQTANGRDVSWVNEVIRAGFSLRNSEVGFAMFDVASFIDILKCLNGMIAPAEVAVRHAGKRQKADEGEVRWLSSATQELDNAALMSRVRDAVLAALDDRQVVQLGNTILAAKTEVPEIDVPTFTWLDNAAERLGLSDTQRDLLKEETTRSISIEGGRSRFALVQGLTATARQIDDFDRRVELERAGWTWLAHTPSDFVKLGDELTAKQRRALNAGDRDN